MRSVRVRVSGVVQGVGFRWAARGEAGRLGLTGWVGNAPDGTVVAVAHGEDDAIDAFTSWLHHGPSGARVDEVRVEPASDPGRTDFGIDR